MKLPEGLEMIEATGIMTQQIAAWKWVKQMETQVFGSKFNNRGSLDCHPYAKPPKP